MLKTDELIGLGNWMYESRKDAGLTQRKLADMVDLDPRQISRYENGQAEMGALLYRKLLILFGQLSDDPQIQKHLQQFVSLTPENRQQVRNFTSALLMIQDRP